MPLGIKPTVDFAFKKIFGSPESADALIGLLNAILALPRPITQVDVRNPFNYQEFAEDKLIVLDIRALDSTGRWLNIEMQVSIASGLLQRLAYYACSLYVDQLKSGKNYVSLQPAISICLLSAVLFHDTATAHHRFRMCDPDQGKELPNAVEVHTVELTKYTLGEDTIGQASKIEQWAFFLLFADQYEPRRLRELLPEVEFQEAITIVEQIACKTEDRTMYDQREKAERDHQWRLEGALNAGLEQGREQGRVQGLEQGRVQGLEQGREEGRRQGVVAGKIQVMQQLLGEPERSLDDLLQQPLQELTRLLAELQERLRVRGG
jgi:predicted transposase/invertase (TIGR01784 family)